MMNYETATDFEINQSVAWALGCHTLPVIDGDIDVFIVPLDEPQIFDPCNSWADAGPIIVENRISIIAHRGSFSAYNFGQTILYKSDKPLRCAMIVFLKMKEAE